MGRLAKFLKQNGTEPAPTPEPKATRDRRRVKLTDVPAKPAPKFKKSDMQGRAKTMKSIEKGMEEELSSKIDALIEQSATKPYPVKPEDVGKVRAFAYTDDGEVRGGVRKVDELDNSIVIRKPSRSNKPRVATAQPVVQEPEAPEPLEDVDEEEKSPPTITGRRLTPQIYETINRKRKSVRRGSLSSIRPASEEEVEEEDTSDDDTVVPIPNIPVSASAFPLLGTPREVAVSGVQVVGSREKQAVKKDKVDWTPTPIEDFTKRTPLSRAVPEATPSASSKPIVKQIAGINEHDEKIYPPYKRSNKTESPDDTSEPMEMPDDTDAALLDNDPVETRLPPGISPLVPVESVDRDEISEVVEIGRTQEELARKGLVDRLLASDFWRYSIKGEVVEDVVTVGGNEKLVERTVLSSKVIDFIGTIGGSRLALSLPSALYQRQLISKEQKRILEVTTHPDTDRSIEELEARIAGSKHLTADRKKVLTLRLKQLVEARDTATEEQTKKIQSEIVDVVERTIVARENLTTVSRDAINAATMVSGLYVLRAAGYLAATGYKAARRWEGETRLGAVESNGEAIRNEFNLWWKKLRGGDSGRRIRGMAEAVLTVAPTLGVLYQANDWLGLSDTEIAKQVADKLPIHETPSVAQDAPLPIETSHAPTPVFQSESIEAPIEYQTAPDISTVQRGDGITWILMRQFKERATELGYDPTTDGDIHEWARQRAAALAKETGYLDDAGFESRIKTEAIGTIAMPLNEAGDGFSILHQNGTPIDPSVETSLYLKNVHDTPALLSSQGVEYVAGALDPDDAVRAVDASSSVDTPELSTPPEPVTVPEVPDLTVGDTTDSAESESGSSIAPEISEDSSPGQVAEFRVDSYGKMKVFEAPNGRYTLDLSRFEIRRRHEELMLGLAISPETVDTAKERAFFQTLFAYTYTLDEMRKHGEEGGAVYTGLAKEANRLFIEESVRAKVDVNIGHPLMVPLLKPEYRIR